MKYVQMMFSCFNQINEKNMNRVKSARYLGITAVEHVNWNAHAHIQGL